MSAMKHQAIVANIGHFDNEIDMAGLTGTPGSCATTSSLRSTNGYIQTALDPRPVGGRLMNLGNATGHPSFVMSNSFTNQVIAQIELFANNDAGKYGNDVYVCEASRREGREAAPQRPWVKLTTLTDSQAAYLGLRSKGRTSRITTGTRAREDGGSNGH